MHWAHIASRQLQFLEHRDIDHDEIHDAIMDTLLLEDVKCQHIHAFQPTSLDDNGTHFNSSSDFEMHET